MPHLLQRRLGDLRRQARRLLYVYAASRVLAVTLAVLIVLALADYLLQFRDPGIRLMCSLAIVVVAGWSSYRYLVPSLRARLADVALAQRLEQYYPSLRDRLSSAVEFLDQPPEDPRAGSAALRQATIEATSGEVEQLDLARVLERRAARRALALALSVVAVAVALVALDPTSSRVALARLTRPLGDNAWPKVNDLAFRDPPRRLASGQAFEVALVDRGGRLPSEVRIYYRDSEDDDAPQIERMQRLDRTMVARRDNVTRSFQYRAEGGDDHSMDWITLEVVEPPRVASFEATVYPPDYTGWPPVKTDRNIRALRGSHVALTGKATRSLRSATVRQEQGPHVPARLADDHRTFTIDRDAESPLIIDKSGSYWFDLTDQEGLTGLPDERWEIRAIADQAPNVTLEQPAANGFVTPRAVMPLRILVKDDLAIREVTLLYSRSDKTDVEQFDVQLYRGPEHVAAATTDQSLDAPDGESRVVEHRWELEPLELKPGTQLTLYAAATDYQPERGQSQPRRLTVVTPRELEDRLAQRQDWIFNELRRVLKLQQDTRSQVADLELQLREVGHLERTDVDRAQAASLGQRQVTRALTSTTEGLPVQIAEMLTDLESNRLDAPEVERRMRGILDEVERLGREHLGTIDRELTSAVKGARVQAARDGQSRTGEASGTPAPSGTPDQTSDQVAQSLDSAGQHQDQVVASLEQMLGELNQWSDYRRFSRELAQLRQDQQTLEQATRTLGQSTLTKQFKALDAQQQADLKKLAGKQADLGRRVDKILQQMEAMLGTLQQADPLAAGAVSDAAHAARSLGISGQMREASQHVAQNQVAQAADGQARIQEALDEVLDTLGNRREHELERLVAKLREAEAQLAKLRERQEQLKKKLAQAGAQQKSAQRKQQLQRLALEQKQLQDETQRMQRTLERLQAEAASRSLSQASNNMNRAADAGQQGDVSAAAGDAQAAEQDLDRASQQLAERRRQAESDLADEQVARLEDGIQALRQRQNQALEETQRLEGLRITQGELDRAQAMSVRDLARLQQLLQTQTRELTEKLAGAAVFQTALDMAARQMERAADMLEQRNTGHATQQTQRNAVTRLDQLMAALRDAPPTEPQPQGQAGGAGGAGEGQAQQQRDGIRSIAELRLLKLLQEDLNQRFRQATQPDNGEGRSSQSPDLVELAVEQGRLADLATQMSQRTEEYPEDDPDNLPDVRDDAADATTDEPTTTE